MGPGKIVSNPALGGRPNTQDPLRHPALIEPIHCSDILLDGFSLVNVTGTCKKGIALANVRKAEIRNVNVSDFAWPLLSIHDVTGKGLAGAAQIDGPKASEPIAAAEPYRLH